jgi:hypothetical protein
MDALFWERGADTDRLSEVLNSVRGKRKVTKALDIADEILETFGVEGFYQTPNKKTPLLLYLNTGDSHVETVLYDVQKDALYIDSWENWLEKYKGIAYPSKGIKRTKSDSWFRFASKQEREMIVRVAQAWIEIS